MDRIREEINKKDRALLQFELIESSLRSFDQSQIL